MSSPSSPSAEELTELPPVPRRTRSMKAIAPVTGKPSRSRSKNLDSDEEEEENMMSLCGVRVHRGAMVRKRNMGRERTVRGKRKEEYERMQERVEESDGLSEDSEVEVLKRSERLTRRQRAMKGEVVELEYEQLESQKKKMGVVREEWGNDMEAELKRQQRARLRQMINEKRNKEKRAAMVDKVLRGVTSKRRRITMASEERVMKVGERLRGNEIREGCVRVICNRTGVSLSIPERVETPVCLRGSVKAVYPPRCERDPKTGKRILV